MPRRGGVAPRARGERGGEGEDLIHPVGTPVVVPRRRPELLLPRIVRYLAAAARAAEGDAPSEGFSVKSQAERIAEVAAARRDAERTQAVLLRLLISWLRGAPPAGTAFLAPAAHLPMLADLARAHGAGAGSAHVAGLASVLLGCCLANEEGSSAGHVGTRARFWTS